MEKNITEYIKKVEKLILSDEVETVKQGIQIMETLNAPEIFKYFLDGIEYPSEGNLSFKVESKVWDASKSNYSKRKYLNTVILGLLNSAPEDVDVSLVKKRSDIIKFDFNLVTEIIGELNFPNLKEIVLYDVSIKTLDPLRKLEVQKLYINSADELADMTMINEFNRMKTIELLGAKKLYSLNIGDTLKDLESVNIHNCKTMESFSIKNSYITGLDISGLKKIKSLDLTYCSNIKNISISNCDSLISLIGLENKNLSELTINRCPQLCDIKGLDIAGSVKIKLSYCKKLDKTLFGSKENVLIID